MIQIFFFLFSQDLDMYLQHPPVEVELLDEWCRLYSGFQYITNGFELMEDVPGS